MSPATEVSDLHFAVGLSMLEVSTKTSVELLDERGRHEYARTTEF